MKDKEGALRFFLQQVFLQVEVAVEQLAVLLCLLRRISSGLNRFGKGVKGTDGGKSGKSRSRIGRKKQPKNEHKNLKKNTQSVFLWGMGMGMAIS